MNKYEDVLVFSQENASSGGKNNAMKYFPQNLCVCDKTKINKSNRHGLIMNDTNNTGMNNSLLQEGTTYIQKFTNYPSNIFVFRYSKTKGSSNSKTSCFARIPNQNLHQ